MFDQGRRAIVVVGAQWGDEGKGKLVDVLAEHAGWVVRYQGGANAGHTVQIGEKSFVLHQVPSGILHPGVRCAIGNGVVLDPATLFTEIDELRADGIDVLVDLAGHTANNRVRAFAYQPAPVQVTYLGYANTTGLSAMHYRLTDEWADPPGQERLYTEELVRLPHGFLCYAPPADAPISIFSVPMPFN